MALRGMRIYKIQVCRWCCTHTRAQSTYSTSLSQKAGILLTIRKAVLNVDLLHSGAELIKSSVKLSTFTTRPAKI